MLEDLYKIEVVKKEIEKNYNTPLYIISANRRFAWKIVLSTIPEKEIFKDSKNIFKLLLKGGKLKSFMNTLNKVFTPDLILFYSKEFPLGSKESLIIVGDIKVLCVNYIVAQKLLPLLTKEPFLEFILRQYPDVKLEKLGISEEDLNILKKETGTPNKSILQTIKDKLFPKKGEEILKIDINKLSNEEKEKFIKNFTKVINSESEIKRKFAVIKNLKEKIETNALEEKFQEILIANPWIFGEEYFDCKPGRTALGNRSIPDIKIKDLFNNQSLIIELKRAIKIEKKDSRLPDEIAPNSNILQALWQGIRYLDEQSKKGKYSLVYIVIGSGDKEVINMVNKINFHIHNIRFITYNELVARAEKRLKSYKPFGLNRVISFLKKHTLFN